VQHFCSRFSFNVVYVLSQTVSGCDDLLRSEVTGNMRKAFTELMVEVSGDIPL
jgi:hypothetical protein